MNSKEKLAYEQGLWDEFSAPGFEAGKTDYPVVGIVGIIRSEKVVLKDGIKNNRIAILTN